MKKLIGIVGIDKKKINFLKRKYKRFDFKIVNDSNIFDESTKKINALLVLYEYPVAKKLSLLLKQEYKKFKNIDWLHLSRAGIDECLPYLKNYKFVFTSGKKIQGPNVSEHCMSILLCLTRGIISFIDVDFTKKKNEQI